MKAVIAGALLIVPGAGLAATPAPVWPSSQDLSSYEAALLPADARWSCRNHRFPSKSPCSARRVAEIVGFGDLLKREPRVKAAAGKAVGACLAGS